MFSNQKVPVWGPDREELRHRKQLMFLGKVLTDYTERIQDHLSAVRESTEQLRKLVDEAARQPFQEDRERFDNIIWTMEKNLQRLKGKTQHLHRFAARTEAARSSFDCGEVVEEAVTLSARAARLRRVTLSAEKAETLPMIDGDPVRLHFLVLLLIRDMLDQVGTGGTITVHARQAGQGVVIEVEGEGTFDVPAPVPAEGDTWLSLGQQLVADLGGSLQHAGIEQGRMRASLIVPARPKPVPSPVPPVHQ